MSSYTEIQAQKNAQAARDYKAALADPNLDPAVRAILEETRKDGKHVRMEDDFEVMSNRTEDDACVLPESSECYDIALALDSAPSLLMEKFGIKPQQAIAIYEWHRLAVEELALRELAIRLARLTGFLLGHSNLNLAVHALAYATHTAKANGLGSMRQACKRILKPNGKPVGVAALSKVACWLVGFLDLPPGEGMKSAEAVASYSQAQKKAHPLRKSKKLQRAISRLNPTGENK